MRLPRPAFLASRSLWELSSGTSGTATNGFSSSVGSGERLLTGEGKLTSISMRTDVLRFNLGPDETLSCRRVLGEIWTEADGRSNDQELTRSRARA